MTSQAVLDHLAGGETKIISQENIISESVARALESLSFEFFFLFFFGGGEEGRGRYSIISKLHISFQDLAKLFTFSILTHWSQ